MEIKLAVQLRIAELQLLVEALRLYLQHLQDGEVVPIIGGDAMRCQAMTVELLETIGLYPRREAGEYAVQQSLFKQ